MLRVVEGKEVLEIQSYMPIGQRVLFLLFAFFPLLAPYELIIQPRWHSYLHVFFLFAAVISAGALAVSALLVWASIAGLNSQLRFDKTDGMLTYLVGAPIVRWRTYHCPLENIVRLHIETHDWSDGAPSYSFVTHLADGRRLKSSSSYSKEEIEDMVQQVSAFLGLQQA